jgi:hypothetical protein
VTEVEWLTATDPHALIRYALPSFSPRQFRLLAAGCVELVEHHTSYAACHHLLELGRASADDVSSTSRLRLARREVEPYAEQSWAWPAHFQYTIHAFYDLALDDPKEACEAVLRWVALASDTATEKYDQHLLSLVRDLAGNPFRPVAFDNAWLTSDVIALASGAYHDRAFGRLPILADALQDAGCDNDDILTHCRDANGVHVRGCWVVDLVLGKA